MIFNRTEGVHFNLKNQWSTESLSKCRQNCTKLLLTGSHFWRVTTTMATIRSIGVVGAGQMGSGIAQLAAVHGVDVCLYDTQVEALNTAQKSISSNIQRLVSKALLSEVNFSYSQLISLSISQYIKGEKSKLYVLKNRAAKLLLTYLLCHPT